MSGFIDTWNRVENFVMGLFAICALSLTCFEVFVRYFYPRYLPDWGTEFVVYFVVWAIFIAGSALVEQSRHVRADLIIRLLSPQVQRILQIITLLIGLFFAAVLFWYGIEVVEFARNLDERSESSMLFPLWVYYLGLPTGMGLMIIRYLRQIYLYAFQFDKETMLIGEESVFRDK
ncbi:MAG: TRAP transporter small permease [Methyloligellaceae bacterium]